MMIAIAWGLLLLAGHWLGPARRDWAAAMRAEFKIVAEAGAPHLGLGVLVPRGGLVGARIARIADSSSGSAASIRAVAAST